MPLQTGQILNNRYRIVKLLGQGGFGAVYKAWDTKLNGPCAIKENFDTSPEAERQFAREASILFNLRHPSLPRVFDHFSLPGQGQYLLMDYIEGQDLQEILDQTGKPLPESQVLPWIEQICDALIYMHSQNPPIIHRDIKPANIKITPSGQAVLVDFGIAKVFDPKLKTTLGARAITPGYSPPEQYGQGTTNPRTDVYALGATLYTALTHTTPPDSVDILTKKQPVPAPTRAINPTTSPVVDQAVARAMHLDEDQRFQTILAFKAALTSKVAIAETPPVIRTQVATSAVTPGVTTQRALAQPAVPIMKRFPKWLPWAGIGVIALVILVLIGIKLTSRDTEEEPGSATEVSETSGGLLTESGDTSSQTGGESSGFDEVQVTPGADSLAGLGFGKTLSLQGQIGGNSYAVDVQDNVVLLGVGPRVYILEISDPTSPQVLGISEVLPGVVRDIIGAGSYAYVAAGKGYLRVLDITDLTAPLEVASFEEGSYAQGLAQDGNSLYIADNPFGLLVVDITDPLAPKKIGELNVSGAPSSVFVEGSRAYLAGSSMGSQFVAIDVSNPVSPVALGSVDIPEAVGSVVHAVETRGSYAYVAAGNPGLVVLDVSNPSQPVKVGGFKTSWADGLVIDGDSLYLSDWVEGLYVLDISDPANPKQSGFMGITMSGQQMPGQRNLAARKGQVLIANINQGLTLVNATNPSSPFVAGVYDAPLPGAAFDVVVRGGTATVIEDMLGMFLVDVSDPSQPRQLGFDTSRIHNGLRTPRGVVVREGYAYLVDVNNGFSIYNIMDPSNPVELTRVEEPQGMTDVAVEGNYAYISMQDHKPENRGLLVFDISNPNQPIQAGFVRTDFSAWALAVKGNYAYYPEFIEMGETGSSPSLLVFKIAYPDAPLQEGQVNLTNLAPTTMGIEIAGNYLYLGDQSNGLYIFDISNPLQPVEVGSLTEVRMVMDLVVVGEVVFTASYGTVDVIDVSDPTSPRLVDMVQTPGFSMGIYALENTVFVADFDGGLVIFNYAE